MLYWSRESVSNQILYENQRPSPAFAHAPRPVAVESASYILLPSRVFGS
jgi:hypothetical protein